MLDDFTRAKSCSLKYHEKEYQDIMKRYERCTRLKSKSMNNQGLYAKFRQKSEIQNFDDNNKEFSIGYHDIFSDSFRKKSAFQVDMNDQYKKLMNLVRKSVPDQPSFFPSIRESKVEKIKNKELSFQNNWRFKISHLIQVNKINPEEKQLYEKQLHEKQKQLQKIKQHKIKCQIDSINRQNKIKMDKKEDGLTKNIKVELKFQSVIFPQSSQKRNLSSLHTIPKAELFPRIILNHECKKRIYTESYILKKKIYQDPTKELFNIRKAMIGVIERSSQVQKRIKTQHKSPSKQTLVNHPLKENKSIEKIAANTFGDISAWTSNY